MNSNTLNFKLHDWLNYFYDLHPVEIDMGLSRVSKVWQNLCNTYSIKHIAKQKVISVSGTNGKGSVCQMLYLLLSSKNLKIGVYTSPHIHHFNERIKINDKNTDDYTLIQAFVAINLARKNITLSYFEATTLASLLIFAWKKVDFAILEVGLGGRLDAVNIIDADAAILTSVGIDHEDFLGNDITQIATEKSGIFRPQKPAIYADTNIYQNVISYAKKYDIPLLVNGRDYCRNQLAINYRNKTYQLSASFVNWSNHQLQNASAVIVLLANLNLLPADYCQRLLNFRLPGRLQVISKNPKIIVDVAHNYAAAKALATYIGKKQHQGKIYAVIGMLNNKNHAAVLSAFNSLFDHVYLASTWGNRAYSSKNLYKVYKQYGDADCSNCDTLDNALAMAKINATNNDTIYAFGSFLVAEKLINYSK